VGEHPRILVVDDDEIIRTTLTAILEDEGYVVDTAKSGTEAVKHSGEKFYNVALIDIRLPDMEGTELLTKIGNTTPKTRKIIITGYPALRNAIDALNKGAHAYIVKPFDMGDVLKTIKEQLKNQEEENRYSQEKVTEFIETRVKEIENEEKMVSEKPPTPSS
jgi:two-component system response regulator PilR (NtrC family)